MPNIGIVGSGVAGLHLGLLLQQHGIPATIYTDKTAEQIGESRLLNSVVHHHSTIERERALGVDFWPGGEGVFSGLCFHVSGEQPLLIPTDLGHPSRGIDYRIYLPRLMDAFTSRGGEIVIGPLTVADIERLSAGHDLMVISAGRGSIAQMFSRRPEHSPFERPQRVLCAGLYHGVTQAIAPTSAALGMSPGHGEVVELPIHSFGGPTTALLFEAIPGSDLAVLSELRYDDDPDAFHRTVLDKLRTHFPATFERVDQDAFSLARPIDLLQGAITPTVRTDYARLSTGVMALAVGDVHTVVDPLMGQGANAASYSAWVTGEAILDETVLDERFCARVADRRREHILSMSDWTNLMLTPLPPHVQELLGAMAGDPELALAFAANFDRPVRQMDALATPERSRAFMAGVPARAAAAAG